MHIFKTSVAMRLAICGACLVPTGCTSLMEMSWPLFGKDSHDAPRIEPHETLCLWQLAEGKGVDGLPTRGFSGQVLFLTHGSPRPMTVSGEVRIYLFDNVGTTEEQTKPIHQFDFDPEVWQMHLQQTAVGPAYQVFIPYTRPGVHEAECAIRVRYKPASGPMVFSELTTITLPGKRMEEDGRDIDLAKAESFVNQKIRHADQEGDEQPATTQVSGSSTQPAAERPSSGNERLDHIEQMLELLMHQRSGDGMSEIQNASYAKVGSDSAAAMPFDEFSTDHAGPSNRSIAAASVSADHPLADFLEESDVATEFGAASEVRHVNHTAPAPVELERRPGRLPPPASDLSSGIRLRRQEPRAATSSQSVSSGPATADGRRFETFTIRAPQ